MSPHAVMNSGSTSPTSLESSSIPNLENNSQQTNPHAHKNQSSLRSAPGDGLYDLVAVGFGPANLSLACALHDLLEDKKQNGPFSIAGGRRPRVLFLERQAQFTWHEGMLLDGTKMQISFLKDFATLRNPRSNFTFLNYLHSNDRLVQFANLSTFLPQRIEYQDYMRWCAGWFDDVVRYGREALQVYPEPTEDNSGSSAVAAFQVQARKVETGELETYHAKNVVVAVGGKPHIPSPFPQQHSRVIHSSQFNKRIDHILTSKLGEYDVAVVGGGQSAAECFNDLRSRFPNARTRLILRDDALRPSDDSPFVNEIFDPDRVDGFYDKPDKERQAAINKDRSTNYGVVRIELLEQIYESLYTQRIKEPDEEKWQHRILPHKSIVGVDAADDSVVLEVQERNAAPEDKPQKMNVDAVIVASGYKRDAHEWMVEPCYDLMPDGGSNGCTVGRDYKVEFKEDALQTGTGIWLQGCNEETHGLSDTLLSILATRSAEMVQSIFG